MELLRSPQHHTEITCRYVAKPRATEGSARSHATRLLDAMMSFVSAHTEGKNRCLIQGSIGAIHALLTDHPDNRDVDVALEFPYPLVADDPLAWLESFEEAGRELDTLTAPHREGEGQITIHPSAQSQMMRFHELLRAGKEAREQRNNGQVTR